MPDPVKIEQQPVDLLMMYALIKQMLDMMNPPKVPGPRPECIPLPRWSQQFDWCSI